MDDWIGSMLNERKKLLSTYYNTHRQKLNMRMLKIAFIYLFLSIIWNGIFIFFEIPYSRANINYLYLSMFVLVVILFVNKLIKIKPSYMQHLVLFFLVFVSYCLYYGSGYKEAWGYFLVIPILAGLYGELF